MCLSDFSTARGDVSGLTTPTGKLHDLEKKKKNHLNYLNSSILK